MDIVAKNGNVANWPKIDFFLKQFFSKNRNLVTEYTIFPKRNSQQGKILQ
jgi:hypothetical protein